MVCILHDFSSFFKPRGVGSSGWGSVGYICVRAWGPSGFLKLLLVYVLVSRVVCVDGDPGPLSVSGLCHEHVVCCELVDLVDLGFGL